jgi:circadian clock protein KaiB
MTPREARSPVVADDAKDYALTLFVSGASELSARAITNATRLCEAHLGGHYRLSVVDVHSDAAAVLSSHVVAVPTLVRVSPLPVRKIAGDLSNADDVLLALLLRAGDIAAETPR